MFIKIHVTIIECEILFSLNAINSQNELKTYESIDLKIFDIEKKSMEMKIKLHPMMMKLKK